MQNKILSDMIDEIKQKGLEAMQHKFAQEDGPMEGNAFAQAVQKAKAAGMKKGDKFQMAKNILYKTQKIY